MTSRPAHPCLIESMKARVRAIVARNHATLADGMAGHDDAARAADDKIAQLERAAPSSLPEPPREFLDAHQTPGPSRWVHVPIQGRDVQLLVSPRGYADPEAERLAWARINEVFTKGAR